MRVVTIHQAKTHLSRLIQDASNGSRGKAVARLVPLGETRGTRQSGSLKGQLRVGSEFFEALPSDEIWGWE